MKHLVQKIEISLVSVLIGLVIARFLHMYVDTFFYICFIASLASLLTGLIYSKICQSKIKRWKSGTNSLEERVTYSIIAMLITFSFLSTVPLNIDRSFSVWMLNQISNQESLNKKTSVLSLKNQSAEFFSPDSGEIARRISEQIEIGNIVFITPNSVQLTSRGKLTTTLNHFISKFFLLNPKYAG